MQHEVLYWRRAQSNLPPGCIWRLWQNTSTPTEPFHPNGIFFADVIDIPISIVQITVLPIKNVKTVWNSIQELFEHAYQLRAFTPHCSISPSTVITSHCAQHRMNGPSSITLCNVLDHSDIASCGCWNGIQLLCITFSLCTRTCLITWTALCMLYVIRRLNWRKTYTLQWSLLTRSCPNIMLKLLQLQICFSFQHTSLIFSRRCTHSGSRTKKWKFILRTTPTILPNTRRHFCHMWRMNTVPNIDIALSLNRKAYWTIISSSPHWFQELDVHLSVQMISPVLMTIT